LNYLQVVFWDYPKFIDTNYLKDFIGKNKDNDSYFWAMQRFIEHGRVVDTLDYFNLSEIKKSLSTLKISHYNKKKWNRIIEVYDKDIRK
jgi:hypothetical protein